MLENTRVLILTTAYLPQIGGSELAIKNTTDRLPEIKFDLITSQLSKDVPEYERICDVNVYRVGEIMGLSSFLLPKNFFPISVFLKAVKLIRKQGHYDVIHAYQASQAAGGVWLLKWVYPKTPFLLTIQEGKDLNRQPWLMRFLRHFIFRKADVITVISSGEQAKELKTKSSLLGLENNIEFIGEVPNDLLPQYLAKASIFVRPSLSEGLGIAFLEAMAAGLPVVATPVGGIPDFLKDGETGLFCR